MDGVSGQVGRTALVTGASRGIGQAIAARLAAEGGMVIVHFGTDESGAAATVEAVERAGGAARAVRAELGVDGDVETLFAGVEDCLSGRPLDILVNNAAAAPAGPLGATTRAEFDRLFAVNVRAPYFIVERALPLLRDGGRIITISSVATRMANSAQTSFAMTKAAVETMSRTLANQLGPRGITVNAVAPGATRTAANGAVFDVPGLAEQITALTALDRLGGPDDVADVVAFLASDAARWITGQVIDASGGLFLGPRV
ncbi:MULTISPECIES: SDR family NAD(P)-dependent oxidoreductase [Streptomyces]|uniref:SDR family oxidoreductase n=1 Tax=Streptomyces koelreuteriae TaxID=2838015 RepID=A0ABX8FSY6_9ACTN|nr:MULTISPECIES: SDR family oxidoreductase [Streptomyces]QWB24232.1 SDR family oxidoreductase [Streptomyces koelreuteriae]UUA07229.1 SDR family oxidoreductase [Streptomyces koelreuteriae]UUA14858.1 SDR family oxidoreductase [Streptomyces sp. CRCS-T-1]